jgi:hypothetical protein
MTPPSLIREKPVNPYSRSGNPQKRIPSAGSPPSAGHTPEGVGFAAASASVSSAIITRAELAQCTCPEHCERDHEND